MKLAFKIIKTNFTKGAPPSSSDSSAGPSARLANTIIFHIFCGKSKIESVLDQVAMEEASAAARGERGLASQ